MRIATWNVNSVRARLEHVLAWLGEAEPDVLALQETKSPDDRFPREAFEAAGYRVSCRGEPKYNGVAVLSREALADELDGLDGLDDSQRRVLGGRIGDWRVLNLYVPNGAEVGSDKYDYKLRWLARLEATVSRLLESDAPLVVLGDFNIAPADADVHDPAAWEGKVLVSPAERQALAALLDLGLSDLFRRFDQPPDTYSWWDYRAAAFRRNRGLRIDLVLGNVAAAAACTGCGVDSTPRGWEKPSDHAPVVASFSA